ncbi:hypothetical protein QBC33DRAFT_157542 [Phialemonium atrogriseum]|uniref:Uncharacterized protein n=1 Tax=Phialemonium atrogriseum TaxID=1093897 RepID=A0AAJ0C7V4_9PEZI|nr:uncharacterized protein QBC33DRAFT_157542 [Phialemonium atrogriseum]KAK1771586.1 hypothetical protein QBC33DRAFT_157542 [Phialemonium atrogriseum]
MADSDTNLNGTTQGGSDSDNRVNEGAEDSADAPEAGSTNGAANSAACDGANCTSGPTNGRCSCGHYHARNPDQLMAAIIQITGRKMRHECFRCQSGGGPWEGCIVAICDQTQELTKGACANCIWNGLGYLCTIHRQEEFHSARHDIENAVARVEDAEKNRPDEVERAKAALQEVNNFWREKLYAVLGADLLW